MFNVSGKWQSTGRGASIGLGNGMKCGRKGRGREGEGMGKMAGVACKESTALM